MITLRTATLQDIPLIRSLAGDIWFETYKTMLSAEQMDYMFEMMYSEESLHRQMAEEGHVFFIASDGTSDLGYVSIEKQSGELFHMHKLYVLPGAQKTGLGKMMIQHVFDYAKKHASGPQCFVELNVNRDNPAVNFYLRMGMEICDKGDFPIGHGFLMTDYIMRKTITL